MLLSELIQEFRVKLDKLDTESYPEIPNEVVVLLINEACKRFVKQRYGGTNAKGLSFEESQKRSDDTRTVVQYATIPVGAAGFWQNSNNYSLPADYWFSVIEQIDVVCNDCNGVSQTNRVGLDAIQHNNINEVEVDPFNKPEDLTVNRVMQGNNIVAMHASDCTVGDLYIGYISNNFVVSIADLANQYPMPDHAQSEIIDVAVTVTLDSIESGRFNINRAILSENE